MKRFIYYLTMFRSKRVIIQEYGKEFWCGFKDTSDKLFKLVLKDTPDIGKSVFLLIMHMLHLMLHGIRRCANKDCPRNKQMTLCGK